MLLGKIGGICDTHICKCEHFNDIVFVAILYRTERGFPDHRHRPSLFRSDVNEISLLFAAAGSILWRRLHGKD